MDAQKISNELATLKRAVKSAATAPLKEKLKNKIKNLEQVLKDANIPAKKLAMMLLGAKRKVASYTQAEFNAVIKRLSYKAEYSFLKGLTKVEVKDDLKREAKTPGWRFKGRDNFKIPTKKDLINDMGKPTSKRKTYYESRSNRSDVTRPALLETGGGVKIMPQQGTLLTKDKKLKLDYKKNGNNFEFVVYEGETNPVANYTKTSFKKKENGIVTMDYNQFINYIYAEGYIDDKNYNLGGGVENDLEEEDFDLFEDFDNLPQDVQDIFFEYEDIDDTYERNKEMLSRLKPLGYTFDYGLDAVPFGLKKMATGGGVGMKKIKINGLKGYMPGVDYVYYDNSSKKYYFKDFEGDLMELKNIDTLKQIHKMEKGGEVKEGDIVTWENKKYKVGKEDKEIKNFYLLNMDGTYAQNPNGSSLMVHKSKLKKMATGGGIDKKIIVETYKGKLEYNNQDIQEMIDNPNLSSDNLPSWLYKTALAGNPDFPKNKKKVIEVLEKIKNSKNDVYINVSSKEPIYKHIIRYETGGGVGELKGLEKLSNNDLGTFLNTVASWNPPNLDYIKQIGKEIERRNNKKATGGGVEAENKEMVLNNAQQIEHHAEELENAARKAKHIPAWVVAKIYNASSNISDATHYLEGVNTMPKEQYERIHAEIENNKMETGGGLNSFLDMQMAVSKICKSNGCTIKDYYLAEKKYSAGGGVGGTFDSSSTGVGIGGTDSSSQSGKTIGGTAASSMAEGGGISAKKMDLTKLKEWKKQALKDSKIKLEKLGFNKNHKMFEQNKATIDMIFDYVQKLINKGVYDEFGVRYSYNVTKYETTGTVIASRNKLSDKFKQDWISYKKEFPYSDVDRFYVTKFSEIINPIWGTNFGGSSFTYDGYGVGFNVWKYMQMATGGGVGETCEIFDSNGERAIDNKSIEKLTKCVTALPQTKSSNIDSNGNYTKERQKLHTEIINKFKKDVVCIKKGKPIAVLMGGSPASGKSTFLKKYRPYLLSDSLFKVDADEIRAELPEYKGWNATQTHEETGNIVDVLISDKNVGIPCKFDFVFDGTMSSTKRYKTLINILRKEGYDIYIVFMGNIPKDVIKGRALERYKKSGRFVPMFVIEDFYANGEKNLKELKSMVDGYIVVDGSSYDYKIIEQGGKKLPNKRLYEKLGEKITLKTGGGVDKKKKTDFTISEYIQLEKQKLREHNSKAHEDDRLDWADWKSELTKEDTKEYGIYYNSRMLDSNGDRGVFEYMPTNKNFIEDDYAKGGPTKAQQKVGKVMHEFKEGTLHSGKSDKIVKNPKQAIAIALSESKRGWKHKK